MKTKSEEFAEMLSLELERHADWPQVVDVVRKNTAGGRWLVGSAVYKTLVRKIYDHDCKVNDWDFFVDRRAEPIVLPQGWEAHTNSFGNPKLRKGALSIDLAPLATLRWIVWSGSEPTIENFLAGTPLNIQSIAFNVDSKKLIGEIGMQSILRKAIRVHNREEYDESIRAYGIRYSIEKYRDELGFTEET